MGSYVVKFLRNGSPVYTFPSPAPFAAPKFELDYTNTQPPTLTSVLKTWDLEGLFSGSSGSTVTAWNALTAVLANPTGFPDEVQLLDPSSTIIDRISTSTNYALFKIESLESPRTDGQWRDEMRFRMRVSGRLIFALVGYGNGISDLDQRISWNYSPEGLLTQTVSGKVQTIPGNSAVGAAKTLGLQLPGTAFAFTTNGPGGVDIEQTKIADTEATFTSAIQQAGVALPPGVAPDYSYSISVSQASGKTVTVRTVRAHGVGAVAAVSAAKPSGPLVSADVESDSARMTAMGKFVTRDTSTGGTFVQLRQFSIRGGGTPVRFTSRTGRRDPVASELPRTALEITERVTVIVVGVVTPNDLPIPAPLSGGGLIQDTDATAFDPYWTRAEAGVTTQGDLWMLGLVRVYRAPNAGAIDKILETGALSVTAVDTTTARGELRRKG